MADPLGHWASLSLGDGCLFGFGGSFNGEHAKSSATQMYCEGMPAWKIDDTDALPIAPKGGHAWVDGSQLRMAYFPWRAKLVAKREVAPHRLWSRSLLVAEPLMGSGLARYHFIHPLSGLSSHDNLPVLPVLLNLKDRVDR